ncbi:GntR family transcriptional regulator [Mycobacterium sherrisii]|uniref:GntR family transcriptional regulator n=2 Tax=Mycobacterium sherrisii TaxID=243061 RepID=A0A1E3T5T2_9MYCO|nr:GntR family transcriptional regulator [Mycobacterium sherrisii]ODR09730.1 GntR family transcriptional regulator [Mycobacterium sherrisii]
MATMRQASAANGPVSAGAGVPLHRQLFLVLHDEIDRGVLSPGDALPTEQTLCDQFGVSRITVRRALADLADQGYIERRRGVGSFVCEHGSTTLAAACGSYLDGLRQAQFETEVEVLELDPRRRPPRFVADALQTSEELLQIVRLRRQRRTGEPLIITEAWLPSALAERLTVPALQREPLYELLSGLGVVVQRVQHEITAEIAGPRSAHLLDTAIGAALLRVNRVAFVADQPHHYLSIVLSPSRSRVLMTQSAAELETGGGFAIAHDVRRDPR